VLILRDDVKPLLEEEKRLRSDISEKIKQLLVMHEDIIRVLDQKEKEARHNPLYPEVRMAHGSYIIRFKRCTQVVKALMGTFGSIMLPGYKDINLLLEEKQENLDKKEKFKAKRKASLEKEKQKLESTKFRSSGNTDVLLNEE